MGRQILEANHFLSQTLAGDWTAVRQTAETILADTREAIGRIRSMQGENSGRRFWTTWEFFRP